MSDCQNKEPKPSAASGNGWHTQVASHIECNVRLSEQRTKAIRSVPEWLQKMKLLSLKNSGNEKRMPIEKCVLYFMAFKIKIWLIAIANPLLVEKTLYYTQQKI